MLNVFRREYGQSYLSSSYLPCLIISNKLLLVYENTIATQLNLDSQKIQPLHLYFIVSYIVY